MQETDHDVAKGGHDLRALPDVNQAGIFPEGDGLAPRQPVLDQLMVTFQGQQAFGRASVQVQTSDAAGDRSLLDTPFLPWVLDPEDLGESQPIGPRRQASRDHDRADVGPTAMPRVDQSLCANGE